MGTICATHVDEKKWGTIAGNMQFIPPDTVQNQPLPKTQTPAAPVALSQGGGSSSWRIIEVAAGLSLFFLIVALFSVMWWYGGMSLFQPTPSAETPSSVVAAQPVEETLGGSIYIQVSVQENPLNNAPSANPVGKAPNPFDEPTYKNPFSQ